MQNSLAPDKPFFAYYSPGLMPRAASCAQGMDREV